MFALLAASAAVLKSAAREQTVLLPYTADLAILLADSCERATAYETITGAEHRAFHGTHDGWDWRVVLTMPVAPQAARYR